MVFPNICQETSVSSASLRRSEESLCVVAESCFLLLPWVVHRYAASSFTHSSHVVLLDLTAVTVIVIKIAKQLGQ